MADPRCPGQDMRYWKPEDIFMVECPHCQSEVEIWRDEPYRYCPACRQEVRNPKRDLGCAKWCKHSEECLGAESGESRPMAPLSHRILGAMMAILGPEHPEVAAAGKTLEQVPNRTSLEDDALLISRAVTMLRGLPKTDGGALSPKVRQILENAGLSPSVMAAVCRELSAR